MYLCKDGITREAVDQPTIDILLKAGYRKVEDTPAPTEPEKAAEEPGANQVEDTPAEKRRGRPPKDGE